MKPKFFAALIAITVTLGWQAHAQTYDTNGDYVQTFAGSGFSGYVDGVGQQTMFDEPNSVVADSHGNLFVWDDSSRIREIAPSATVSTLVSNLFNTGVIGGTMTIDHNNTIWLVGEGGVLTKITTSGSVTSTNLPLEYPLGICVDSQNNLYFSDFENCRIYRYANGVLSVFAGSGNSGYINGNGLFTAFDGPEELAADEANNIYVWDAGNALIRRIDQSQNVTTFAGQYQKITDVDGVGTNAAFADISQMCFDNSGNLYLACADCIRKIDAATNVVTLAGSFMQAGYTNGPGNLARFNGADGICLSGGMIYIADSNNQRIRNITNNPTSQIVSAANLQLGTYSGLQIIGTVGRTYQIQTSPDLNSWSTTATILLNSSPYLWIDQNPMSGNKFYRALLLP